MNNPSRKGFSDKSLAGRKGEIIYTKPGVRFDMKRANVTLRVMGGQQVCNEFAEFRF